MQSEVIPLLEGCIKKKKLFKKIYFSNTNIFINTWYLGFLNWVSLCTKCSDIKKIFFMKHTHYILVPDIYDMMI